MKKLLVVLALLGAIVCCNENVLAAQNSYQKSSYTQQQKKFNPVSYCYGATYKAYLNSGKKNDFKVQLVQAQKYACIFYYFKKQGFVNDVKVGKTLEDATVIYITGFNAEKFKEFNSRYCNAIERKIAKK